MLAGSPAEKTKPWKQNPHLEASSLSCCSGSCKPHGTWLQPALSFRSWQQVSMVLNTHLQIQLAKPMASSWDGSCQPAALQPMSVEPLPRDRSVFSQHTSEHSGVAGVYWNTPQPSEPPWYIEMDEIIKPQNRFGWQSPFRS